MLTKDQASYVHGSIVENSGKSVAEHSKWEIYFYLVELGFEDSDENVEAVRNA